MNKLTIVLLLLAFPIFAQTERMNITDGGSICEDKNNDQVNQIAKAIDMNQRFTGLEISNICHASRNSAQGRNQGKNDYRFEELMMIYLNIEPLAQYARKTLKSYIDKNYKVITCNAYLSHPEGGILVNLASARNLGQLTTFC